MTAIAYRRIVSENIGILCLIEYWYDPEAARYPGITLFLVWPSLMVDWRSFQIELVTFNCCKIRNCARTHVYATVRACIAGSECHHYNWYEAEQRSDWDGAVWDDGTKRWGEVNPVSAPVIIGGLLVLLSVSTVCVCVCVDCLMSKPWALVTILSVSPLSSWMTDCLIALRNKELIQGPIVSFGM